VTRDGIWLDIITERFRQERLCAQGKFPATLAHKGALPMAACLAVLAEEFGEVARPVADDLCKPGTLDRDHLREELIQLAACCVAWVEQLDGIEDLLVAVPYRDTLRPSAAPEGAVAQ
jgi:hypothetical protein